MSFSGNQSYDALVKQLKAIRKALGILKRGFRDGEYEKMGEAVSIALAIDADKDKRAKFLEEYGKKGSMDIIYTAMIFVMRAKSKLAEQKAWKRARGLTYAVKTLNVPIEEIPSKVRELGGIEALAALATDKDPRRKTAGKGKIKRSKPIALGVTS